MFSKVFVEKSISQHPTALKILGRLGLPETHSIDAIEDIFGRVKKPYLQKRQGMNLFIGKKKGQLVKSAPLAYGLSGEPHYYFIHTYNCIYECEYCYLQGYFNSPDLVMFVNHDEISNEMINIYNQQPNGKKVWFHAGEFSDSLALSHLTGECEIYWDLFKKLPNAYLEFRTKSANIKAIKRLPAQENIIISYSLAPESKIKSFEHRTATFKQRLKCIETLHKLGHPIGIHLDPIVYDDTVLEDYQQLIKQLIQAIPANAIRYISLGVVRFTKDVYKQVEKNYPKSELLASEFIKSFDKKVRYPRPLRLHVLNTIKQMILDAGVPENNIYLCME